MERLAYRKWVQRCGTGEVERDSSETKRGRRGEGSKDTEAILLYMAYQAIVVEQSDDGREGRSRSRSSANALALAALDDGVADAESGDVGSATTIAVVEGGAGEVLSDTEVLINGSLLVGGGGLVPAHAATRGELSHSTLNTTEARENRVFPEAGRSHASDERGGSREGRIEVLAQEAA